MVAYALTVANNVTFTFICWIHLKKNTAASYFFYFKLHKAYCLIVPHTYTIIILLFKHIHIFIHPCANNLYTMKYLSETTARRLYIAKTENICLIKPQRYYIPCTPIYRLFAHSATQSKTPRALAGALSSMCVSSLEYLLYRHRTHAILSALHTAISIFFIACIRTSSRYRIPRAGFVRKVRALVCTV